jgi:hypothetical protein
MTELKGAVKKPAYYSVLWYGPELNKQGRPKHHSQEFTILKAAQQYAKQLNAAFPTRKAQVYGAEMVSIAGMTWARLEKV